MSDSILQMRSITKTFAGVPALDSVSLELHRGEIHAICGENGAGKSTLMKILSGVYPFGTYDGDIYFEGQQRRFKNLSASQELGIVIIHQELTLVPEMSVAENIFLGNEIKRNGFIDWNTTRAEAIKLMKSVGLAEDPDILVKDLGVGKQQLVEICKALGKKVKLLILDEPTAALNESDSQHLLGLIKDLKSKGITSVIISHKLNEIQQIADAVTIIRDGKKIETLDAQDINEDRIIKGMVGRELDSRYPPRIPNIGEVAWEIKDWTVANPNNDQLVSDRVSLTFRRGEIVGLAGLMGAGRTELARSVFGRNFGHHIAGKVYRDGKELRINSVPQAIKAGISYVTEDRKQLGFNPLDDVKTTTVSVALDRLVRFLSIDTEKEQQIVEEYRQKLKIKTPTTDTNVTRLSGGNQQKVVLAKWMYADPDFLILDEPTRGVDVGAKYEIYTIINQLVADGKSVLLISSELPELLGMADRIYTLFEGRVTGEFKRGEVDQETLMRYMTSMHESKVTV